MLFIIYIYKQTESAALSIGLTMFLLICVCAFLLLITDANPIVYIFRGIFQLQTISEQGLWKAAVKMIILRPGKGWGADMFYWRYPEFTASGMPAGFTPAYRPNNIFLDIGTGTGLLGILVFIWFIFSITITLKTKLFGAETDSFRWPVQAGALCALSAIFICSQFNSFLNIHEILGLFWALLGIGVCSVKNKICS